MRRAHLSSCVLRDARMTKTNLEMADLDGADLTGAVLTGANLGGTGLDTLKSA